MEAAAEVFAEKGYDGARVDELARAAGVVVDNGDIGKLDREVLRRRG